MVDEALDLLTNDMAYSNYDEQIVSDAAQVMQNVQIRLKMIKGEFYRNQTAGNIDFDTLSQNGNIQGLLDASIKATIKSTPEVNSLLSYSSTVKADRVLAVGFSIDTIYGVVTTQQPIEV